MVTSLHRNLIDHFRLPVLHHSQTQYVIQQKSMPIQTCTAEYRENTAGGCNWASLWQIFRFRVSIDHSGWKIDQLQTKMIHNFCINSSTTSSSPTRNTARLSTRLDKNW
jgi:hypothetical protein